MDGNMKWYAIRVREGEEDRVVSRCGKANFLKAEEEIFTLKRKKDIHGLGRWWTDEGVLFSGYVFAKTNEPERVLADLITCAGVQELLSADASLMPVSAEEAGVLDMLGGDAHRIDISVGYKDETGVVLLYGPLCGLTDKISKINRHQRMARIEVPLFNGMMHLWVGLRVLGSSREAEAEIRNLPYETSTRPVFPEGMRKQYA